MIDYQDFSVPRLLKRTMYYNLNSGRVIVRRKGHGEPLYANIMKL